MIKDNADYNEFFENFTKLNSSVDRAWQSLSPEQQNDKSVAGAVSQKYALLSSRLNRTFFLKAIMEHKKAEVVRQNTAQEKVLLEQEKAKEQAEQ